MDHALEKESLPYKQSGRRHTSEPFWRTALSKSIFLSFCWISFLIFAGLGALVYYLVHPRLISLSPATDLIVLIAIGGAIFIVGAGLFLITATAITGIDLLYPHSKHSITVSLLFPIAATLSQFIGVSRNRLRSSFVAVNNAMTKAQRKRIKGERMMVLLPHCLQIDICNRKITNNIDNCVRCGRCPVGELIDLGKKYGTRIEVVNGGTLARRRVKEFRPDCIIAVACERDLTFGIQDVFPVPVFGVINDRPNGPCVNTNVDMRLVEEAICYFRKPQTESP